MRPLRYFHLWLVLGWLAVATVVLLSLISQPPEVPLRYGDKWGHLLAYGVLMGWFVQLYQRRGMLLLHALFFVVLGVALEFLQGYTGRYFEYADMAANTGGVALGLALAFTPWQSLLLRWESRLAGSVAPR
ncbi:MAG: VanZ family protein [Gammaproteobacteria bacterium]|nr:VanZ family protein [Gammaproteobacteria bacterium]